MSFTQLAQGFTCLLSSPWLCQWGFHARQVSCDCAHLCQFDRGLNILLRALERICSCTSSCLSGLDLALPSGHDTLHQQYSISRPQAQLSNAISAVDKFRVCLFLVYKAFLNVSGQNWQQFEMHGDLKGNPSVPMDHIKVLTLMCHAIHGLE